VPNSPAYLDALKMLARRELSEAQVRARLARRGHADDEVEEAVARLLADRAIDDARVAEAIAHAETTVRRRGRLRVRREIERAGIAPALARRATDAVSGALDEGALLEEVLARRLRGAERIDHERQFARLFRYLVAQGFEPERVVAALRKRKPG
jgi:regulatory protein